MHIGWSQVMTLQMYLLENGLIQLGPLVIKTFNTLKSRVYENKDLKCVVAYLLACEQFEMEVSDEEIEELKKMVKGLVSKYDQLPTLDTVWSRRYLDRYLKNGPQTPFKAYIKNLKQQKPQQSAVVAEDEEE